MDQPGLLEWCNATRFTMANDPGRELFQEQIQTHGFLFLTDYLDNILAGPRQDPLIELVKTPGRKKATSKKPAAPASALKSVVTLSLEDGDENAYKENTAPVNSFHRALLQAKDNHTPDAKEKVPAPTVSEPRVLELNVEPIAPVITPKFADVAAVDVVVVPVHPPSPPTVADLGREVGQDKLQLLNPLPVDQNDLSMIAEDDETERSRVSLPSNDLAVKVPLTEQATVPPNNSMDQENIIASSSSTDTFHTTLSPDRPQDLYSPATLASNRRSQSPNPQQLEAPQHSLDTQPEIENHTAPLPVISSSHARTTYDEAITEPLPPLPAMTDIRGDTDLKNAASKVSPSSPKGLTHKASVPSFSSFPAPLPFRKSIRAPPDSSVGHGPLGSATPGAALGGKRTSWLMRAREVKALELTTKKPSPMPSTTPRVSGIKRKSGDIFGDMGVTGLEDDERKPKASKNVESDVAPLKPKVSESDIPGAVPEPDMVLDELSTHQPHEDGEQEGLLVKLKRTVDGLGVRVGKSMGKSLGGAAAANALAEARAAAEARIAERHHKEEEATMALGPPSAAPIQTAPSPIQYSSSPVPPPVFHTSGSDHRLSVSELVTSAEKKGKNKEVGIVDATSSTLPFGTSHVSGSRETDAAPQNTITAVPDSARPAPVFNKPPPVFVPPAPSIQAKLPMSTAFSVPAPMTLGLAPRFPSPGHSTAPLSAQSTLESVRSDALFDSQNDTSPAWMPSTQDTEYTSGFGSQSQCSPPHGPMTQLDEDDSWPMDEKLAAGVQWTFGKEESLTWSTLPTESQRADTGPMPPPLDDAMSDKNERDFHPIPGSFNMDIDDEYDVDEAAVFNESVLAEMEIDPKNQQSALSTYPMVGRSQSQMSTASSASSQSQVGFLGHASKLMSSVLGTSKKAKPEVKSLQLAAAAAKKQQEEKEKKASRLKEMENRRQAALQRKAEEEKAKAQDEERRLKEESDRRKKDRDDTDKRPLKSVIAKKEEENSKKKPEVKKPALKPALTASTSSKASSKPAFTKPQVALASSASYNTASSSKVAEPSLSKSTAAKGKLATKNVVPDDDLSQPSQILQTQMAARAKAQLQAANLAQPTVASESIELPDINSEYSDSEDEDRPRTFDPPAWAQSPDLRQALQIQSTINPDAIFGAIRPLRMDELFRNRTGRFRARTSSANWTGTDRLTVEEEREYVRRMGFR